MSDKLKVIVNPYGGGLAGPKKVALIEQALQTVGLDYHLEQTDSAADGCKIAHQAALEGWPIVAAAGGDGTVNSVVNGLIRAAGQQEPPILAIFPLGTANDLADMLDLPRDITAICQRIAAQKTRQIDVGVVNNHYFVNNSAVGLEPVISLEHERMRRVKGELRYLLAALKGIAKAQTWEMTLRWDTGSYEGATTLVSVGNTRRTGGVFYMTPRAKLDDGLLDFVYAFGMGRLRMCSLLPSVLKGKHINHPLVVYLQTRSLTIKASPPTPIQADGEVIDTSAVEITYRILPRKLRVII